MLTVSIPDEFSKEISYTFHVLLKEFLGLDYNLNINKSNSNFEIIFENKKLTIKNAFFSNYNKKTGYLSIDNIPSEIKYLSNFDFKVTKSPILFGEALIEENQNNLILHADIIASTFFMLTRWEEYVIKTRDKHNRFPAEESLAYKHNFLNRPIVNEYVELIWEILQRLGYTKKRKERKFEVTLTHDVDVPKLWWNTKDFIKSILSELIKRRNVKEAISLLKFKIKNKDPFDTFDYLMNLSEKQNLKSHFFFMSGGTSDKDNFYKINHPFILKLLKKIDQRGHLIGFHPSYNAYNDGIQYQKELTLLQQYSPQKIKTGREHYLRFEVPTTWQIWEDHQMKWDSTMSYHNKPGFRCGVCYDFPVFNIITQKQLNLIEKPLIVMEGSFITYQNKSPLEMEKEIVSLINQVKIYNGNFVFLWHNSAFNRSTVLKFQHIYKNIVENLFKK